MNWQKWKWWQLALALAFSLACWLALFVGMVKFAKWAWFL
jgi:hypothetical protein